MTREVVLTETAQQQMNAAADWYAEQNPTVAAKWFNGLIQTRSRRFASAVTFPLASKQPLALLTVAG